MTFVHAAAQSETVLASSYIIIIRNNPETNIIIYLIVFKSVYNIYRSVDYCSAGAVWWSTYYFGARKQLYRVPTHTIYIYIWVGYKVHDHKTISLDLCI